MATRLESGQVNLRGASGVPMQQIGVPQVDFVAPRVEAQGNAQLAQALDRMAAQVTQDAAVLRQREGLQFAAQNPLTFEQLEAAKNGDTSQLKLSDNPLSVFGNAVRKARSLELSSHFEIEGRNELTKLLADIDNGTATSEQVSQKIATMTDGMGKSLAQIDSDAAFKFRATMATYGSTVLKTAYEHDLKREKQRKLIKFDQDFDNISRLMEATVSQGFWTDSTGQQRSIDELADVMRRNVSTNALLIGDSTTQKVYSDKFEKVLRDAKVNAVTKEYTQNDAYIADPIGTLNRIKAGDAGKMSAVLKGMITNDFESVAKVEANFMTAVAHRETLKEAERKALKIADIKEFVPLYEKAIAAPEGSATRRQFASQIAVIAQRNPDAVPLSVLKDLLEPSKEGNPAAEFNMIAGIYSGSITTPEQIWNNNALNGKQKVAALKLLTSEDRRDQAELDRGLARLANIQTMPGQVTVIDPKGVQFKQLQDLRAEAMQIQAQATAEGKILQPREILRQVEDGLQKRRNSEAAKAARKALDDVWSKKNWINGPITRDSVPALRQKAGSDKNKNKEIDEIEKLLNQLEGIR